MEQIELCIASYPIIVNYRHSKEKDPYGTGDSPTAHYVDIVSIYLNDSNHDVYDLFYDYIDEITDEIIESI